MGNVVIGMEKCGKMCEMCENVEKCAGDPFSIYYSYYFETFFISLKSKIDKTVSFSPVHVFNQENESEIQKIFYLPYSGNMNCAVH